MANNTDFNIEDDNHGSALRHSGVETIHTQVRKKHVETIEMPKLSNSDSPSSQFLTKLKKEPQQVNSSLV